MSNNLSSSNSFDSNLLVDYIFVNELEYAEALSQQEQLWLKNKESNINTIMGLEHPTVMTLGLRAHKLDISAFCTTSWNYPIVKINRGGLATIHSPGQLVIYPIVNLNKLKLSIKEFVNMLFLATQKTLLDLGVQSTIDLCHQPGVYTENGKIAFCGMQVKNGITMHGLSINISNDVNLFSAIQSCGVQNAKIDSLKNYKDISTFDFFNLWKDYFTDYIYSPDLTKSSTNCDLGLRRMSSGDPTCSM